MFKSSPDNKLLAILGILVLGLAFPTYRTLAGEPVVVAMEDVVSVVMPQRAPASVPSAPILHLESVDLGCKKTLSEIKASGQYLQLKGQICRGKNLVIVNKSNGYTASVFELGQGRYQTDMIQLTHGANELEVRYENQQGEIQEHKVRVSSSHIL